MENETYRIIIDGICEGHNPDLVKAGMAALFKVDAAVIDAIFKKLPHVLQRKQPKEKALKYIEALGKTGALCRIEKESVSPNPSPIKTSPSPPPPPQPSQAATPQVKQETLYTPPGSTVSPVPPVSPQQPEGTFYTPPSEEPVTIQPESPVEEIKPALNPIEPAAWKALGTGFVIALAVFFTPLSFLFTYLVVLVHEIGHALFNWIFGYPSVPAFDFVYGGGFAVHQDRETIIMIVIYLFFGWLFYLFRRNLPTLGVLAVFTALYSYFAFTYIHRLIIIFMGHGMELIFAGLFLYRAVSGRSLKIPAERPLYAFLGIFTLFMDFRFANRLITSAAYRSEYEDAKGGGHWMDFSRIAEDFLGVELSTVAAFFLMLCILTPVAAFLFYRYEKYIIAFLKKLIRIE
ncbi:MAG: hypothetical protein GY757_61050 [bacterium]|nr:hypothetical protein [bacterium]